MLTLGLLCAAGVVSATAEWPGVDALPIIEELPDPFLMRDGSRVKTPEDWKKRREEIIAMFEHYEYGHMPPAPDNLKIEPISEDVVFDGAATEKRVTLCMGPDRKLRVQAAVYIPTKKSGPLPVILAIEPVWNEKLEPVARRVVEHGYIFAGFDRHDCDKDDADRTDGVHPLYPDYDWATLAAWAWGTMRTVDFLLTLDAVDPARIALTGHSRGGKTALLAAALDSRIALVAPHASGTGGASVYRIQNKNSETLELITSPKRFHYWFQPRLAEFAGKETRLPFDQHFLTALVAPRAVLSVSGLEDYWSNPLGAQHAYVAAQPVFDFLKAGERNAFYFRPGGHDYIIEDWDVLIEFADHIFFNKPATREYHKLAFPDEKKAFSWPAP